MITYVQLLNLFAGLYPIDYHDIPYILNDLFPSKFFYSLCL